MDKKRYRYIFVPMTTRCYYINTLDPYFNLATEEYLLKNTDDDVFMLWRGESSIVVGKHQNALAEINHPYVKEKNLMVARRLSGGGTVFHDPGNINFTFIRRVEHIDKLNYSMFLEDVKKPLKELGLDVYNSERDDLMIDGLKISGNAQHVHRGRVLHHGTLLFNSKLSRLKDALKVDLSRFEDKAVQSKRRAVANISDFLKHPMSVSSFSDYMFTSIANLMPRAIIAELQEEDKKEIQKLRDTKFSKWEWIYGYSPKYIYRNKVEKSELQLELKVKNGCIEESNWTNISIALSASLSEALRGVRHEHEIIAKQIEPLTKELAAENIDSRLLLQALL